MTMKQIAAKTSRRITSVMGAIVALMLVAAAATPSFAAPLINPVIVTNPAGWKYKDGKTSDKISGKAVIPQLASYFSNGFGIGIARVDGTTNSFTPVWTLATKNHKSWKVNIKKTINMSYNAKNGAFVCTVWTQLPPNWAVYVVDTGIGLILGGKFNMGTNNIPFDEQMANAGPNHQVYVSTFYMDKYEVTYTQWTNVRTWATNNGYTALAAGSGKAPNHPVQTVSWYDCVKWCNARSEMEGRTPCYYTSTKFIATNIYKTGSVNLSNNWVNWNANGYRLPTEAEREKAARGGLSGQRFPWEDLNITHTNANYHSSSSYTYDTSATRGFHPAFTNASTPYTSPVDYFAPNGYGLYDMAGNVWEWTWDWYDATWYSNVGATQSDTPGPVSGTSRVLRGGGWSYSADSSRVAYRSDRTPDFTYNRIGFRSVHR